MAFAPYTRFLLIILSPVTYPISLLLDKTYGYGSLTVRYKRSDLKEIIKLHQQNDLMRNGLDEQEVQIINSIIDLKNIQIKDVMIELNKAFILYEEDVVNENLIKKIQLYNFTRIPIFDYNKLCKGFLNTKNLVSVDFTKNTKIKEFLIRRKPQFI